jgi:hypothetical protein
LDHRSKLEQTLDYLLEQKSVQKYVQKYTLCTAVCATLVDMAWPHLRLQLNNWKRIADNCISPQPAK